MEPRSRAQVALAVLVAFGAAGMGRARLGARGIITEAVLPMLALWDRLQEAADPRPEPGREPAPADARPLAEQAAEMRRDLKERFLAYDGRLLMMDTPPVSLGDACLWQGVYAAMEALRYRVEGSSEALDSAERAFDGLLLLASRGRPIARAVYPADIAAEPGGIRFFNGDGWQWKEDASIDSAAGWVFGAVLARRLLPSRREASERALSEFARVLARGGLLLRNSDGSRTRFSTLGGALVNSPTGVLSALSAFAVAERNGSGAEVIGARRRLLECRQDRWGAYASGPMLWRNKSTNHNIGFLALSAALLAEEDPARRALYAGGLVRLERLNRRAENSLWTYLTLWTLEEARRESPLGAAAEDWLARREERLLRARTPMLEWRYPDCKVKRQTRNSTRPGLDTVRWFGLGPRTLRRPLPVWQRPAADFLWQRSAFALDDWDEYAAEPPQRFAPLDFLAAYTLGRAVGAF